MQVKKVINILGAINDTGRLASDMYDLDKKEYYSQARKEYMPIADMDFQHMVRAFVKQNDEDIRNDTQEGKLAELYDSLVAQEKITAGLRSQVETYKEQLEEKDQEYMNYTAMLERQRDMYKNIAKESTRLNGHYYTFCEVPQDEEGKEFIKNCKKYLNKESYTIRVKGQHLKKELYGQGRAYHGANMEDSSHMRVYIDKKRGDE
tara:strand:- start:137 stop:751 length:615 start_codon:yes stop_codon:yes gene_type:complete